MTSTWYTLNIYVWKIELNSWSDTFEMFILICYNVHVIELSTLKLSAIVYSVSCTTYKNSYKFEKYLEQEILIFFPFSAICVSLLYNHIHIPNIRISSIKKLTFDPTDTINSVCLNWLIPIFSLRARKLSLSNYLYYNMNILIKYIPRVSSC